MQKLVSYQTICSKQFDNISVLLIVQKLSFQLALLVLVAVVIATASAQYVYTGGYRSAYAYPAVGSYAAYPAVRAGYLYG